MVATFISRSTRRRAKKPTCASVALTALGISFIVGYAVFWSNRNTPKPSRISFAATDVEYRESLPSSNAKPVPTVWIHGDSDEGAIHSTNAAGADKFSINLMPPSTPAAANNTMKPMMPLVVVDEHQHVLPYWFDMQSAKGADPPRATLVHIDAHSDFAPPSKVQGSWPTDIPKLRFATENDEFIIYSLRLRLIDRIVMVFPPWTFDPHRKDTTSISIGKYKKAGKSVIRGQKVSEWLCECFNDKCEVNEKRVSRSDCIIETKIEKVTMGIAVAKEEGFGIVAGRPVILDIDEDYFAVDSPFVSLMKAGINKKTIKKAQKLLKGIFCAPPPHTARLEQAVDVFLRGVVSIVTNAAGRKDKHDEEPLRDGSPEHRQILQRVKSFVVQSIASSSDLVDALCKASDDPTEVIADTAEEFASRLATKASQEGLALLLSYGFCLHTDEFPRKKYYVWICVGSSDWDDAHSGRIELHHPTTEEVTTGMAEMSQYILNGFPVAPELITVCRSLRDGYVVRKHWAQIENGIMEISQQLAQQHDRELNVTYDHDCYWGGQGVVARADADLGSI